MLYHSFLLSISAFLWGAGFIATKWTLEDYSPLWSNTLRYVLAAFLSMGFLIYKKSWLREKRELISSLIAGMLLLIAMLFQVFGLKYTSVAKSGFITTFYAFFTPLIGVLVLKKKYQWGYWPLMGMGLFGIALLCDLDFKSFNIGDMYTVGCAFFFAIHIIYIDKIVRYFKSAIELNLLQCFWMGIVSLPIVLLLEGTPDLALLHTAGESFWNSSLWGFILLGFFSSIVAFSIQTYAQRVIPPHIVGLIFLMESPFAAILAYLVFNESLSQLALLGSAFVMVSVLLVPIFGKEINNN